MSNVETPTTPEPDHIKALRTQAERAPQLESDVQSRDRDIAMLRAGIDPDTRLGRLVKLEHQGEFTAEALKETATQVRKDLGIPETDPSTPAPPDPVGAAEQTAQQIANALAGGGGPAPHEQAPPKSYEQKAIDTLAAARKAGMTKEEAEEAALGEYIRAGAEGETGARFDKDAWAAEAAKHGHGSEFASLPDKR